MALGHNGHAVGADQLARGWFVGPGQVEEVVHRVAGFTLAHQVIVLSLAEHLAAMGDGLHVVLVLVARLIQGVLGERQEERLINQQDDISDSQNVAFTIAFTRKVVSGEIVMSLLALSLVLFSFHTSHTCRLCPVFYCGLSHDEV